MATDGFDDLLAAYGMPDMATILAGDKQPITQGEDASPTGNRSKDSGTDHVDTGISSPPFPLMASAAAPRMASPTKGTPNYNYQRFSGVSQVSRNSPIWNTVPPGKPKLPQTSRKSVSQRRPKARGRANTRPYTYPEERQMYQSFNITDPSLTPSGAGSAGQNVMVGQQFRGTNPNEPHSAGHKMVSLIQHMDKPKPDNRQNGTNTSNSVVLSIPYGNTLLSKANPLPPYKPPKPPPHLNIPDTRFLCTVCDDTFLFPSSLESHMKRRSIFLKFDCNICQKQVVFYNKCAFHRHIQDHLAVNEQVKVDKADLKFESLSFDVIKEGLDNLSVFSPDFNVDLGLSIDEPTVVSSETAPSPEVGSVGKAADHPSPSADGGQLQVGAVEGAAVQQPISSDILGKYCWECSATFKTKDEFMRHWTSGWEFPSKHDCHRCGLVMPTACSLKAHVRLSRGYQGAPHVCPECGELFDGKNSLDDHTRFQCFHYARTVTYPCPICRQFYKPEVCKRFNDRDAFMRHLMNHSDNYYKCKCCPMAFKSEAGLYGHCVATHAKEDAIQSPQLMIHKCPLCNTVFHQSALLTTHMNWHFEEIEKTRGYEFVCTFCMVKFGSNKNLKEHAWTAHKTLMSEKLASIAAVSEKGTSTAVLSEKVASVAAVSEKGATTAVMSEKGASTAVMTEKGASTAAPRPSALVTSLGRPRKKRPEVVVTPPPDQSVKVTAPSKGKVTKTTDVEKMKAADVKEIPLKVKQKKKKQVKAVQKNAGPKYSLSAPGEETAAGSCSRPESALSSPILSEPDGDGAADSETSATIKGQYAPYECPICHLQYYYRDSLFKHRRVHEKEGKFICLLCSEVFNNKMAQVQHTRICFRIKKGFDSANTQVNMFTCEICDETFFCQDELQKHMQDLHSISVLQQFACLLCGLTYDEKASLEQHIEETHKGSGKKPTYMCWICQDEKISKGFGKRHLLEKHLQKEHKISKNQIDYSRMAKPTAINGAGEDEASRKEGNGGCEKKRSLEGHESNGMTAIVPKRLKVEGDSIYNCAKCKFSSASRKEFQKHIVEHKISRDGIQCLECGMCFIVEPSLRKHLFIVHKIKDYEKYVSDLGEKIPLFTETELHVDVTGGSEVPEKVSLSPESNPLECKVCYRVFEEEARLKNHMRTHGMAFIRSKRAHASPKKVSPSKVP